MHNTYTYAAETPFGGLIDAVERAKRRMLYASVYDVCYSGWFVGERAQRVVVSLGRTVCTAARQGTDMALAFGSVDIARHDFRMMGMMAGMAGLGELTRQRTVRELSKYY